MSDFRFFGLQAETLADKRIVVAIDSWDTDSAYPSGHYVRTLGTIGEPPGPLNIIRRTAHGMPLCVCEGPHHLNVAKQAGFGCSMELL